MYERTKIPDRVLFALTKMKNEATGIIVPVVAFFCHYASLENTRSIRSYSVHKSHLAQNFI